MQRRVDVTGTPGAPRGASSGAAGIEGDVKTGHRIGGLLALAVGGACAHRPAMNLAVPDPRPVHAVRVADADEAQLVQQRLQLDVIRLDGAMVYFHGKPEALAFLRTEGYAPRAVDARLVFERVVRVARRGDETDLRRAGVLLIRREQDHWVVRGSLASLEGLQRQGYRLEPVREQDLRPREIRVTIGAAADARAVAAMGVDVFTVRRTKEGFVVYGGALEGPIDLLRESGYAVEIISTVKESQP